MLICSALWFSHKDKHGNLSHENLIIVINIIMIISADQEYYLVLNRSHVQVETSYAPSKCSLMTPEADISSAVHI